MGNDSALTFIARYFGQKLAERTSLDLNLTTIGGETALFKAVQNLKVNAVSILLQAGANPSIESNERENVFQMIETYDHPHLNLIVEQYKETMMQNPQELKL
jgi:hypothetical protein